MLCIVLSTLHTRLPHLILVANLYTGYHFIDEEIEAQKEGKGLAQDHSLTRQTRAQTRVCLTPRPVLLSPHLILHVPSHPSLSNLSWDFIPTGKSSLIAGLQSNHFLLSIPGTFCSYFIFAFSFQWTVGVGSQSVAWPSCWTEVIFSLSQSSAKQGTQ